MRDYYEVLEVSQDATDDEIRRSYRKLALKLHPDRNFGNVEEATDKFAEVQSAYEVLSEPNERAWYDKNRDSILRGTQFEKVGTGAYTADEIGLTPEEILAYVPKLASCKLDDTPGGFFSLAHTLFEHLHRDEITACAVEGTDCPPVPSFGGTQTDDARVISFYKAWSGFSSSKKFDWAERYRFERSHDRRFRRLVDKENAKLRLAARRAYNDAVGQVLSAVRKRDFRLPDSSVGAAQRQAAAAALRKEQQEQARLKKQADRAEYQEQDWQKVQGQQAMEEEMQQFEEFALEIECVACSKTFKSEKQYAGHARSKKHLQTVKRLKWEMKKEARELGLDSDFESDSDADEEAYRTCEEDAGENEAVPGAVASQKPQADQQEGHPVNVTSELDMDALTLSERDSDDDHETPPPSPPPMATPPKKTNKSKRKKQQAKAKLRK